MHIHNEVCKYNQNLFINLFNTHNLRFFVFVNNLKQFNFDKSSGNFKKSNKGDLC